MTGINQLLEIVGSAIILVNRKIHRGVVPPAAVTLELIHRHQLDGIHPKPHQIIKCIPYRFKVVLLHEVAHQHLIDDERVCFRGRKTAVLPHVFRRHGLEDRDQPVSKAVGVRFQIRISGLLNPLVVPRVKHLGGIWIGDPQRLIYQVLEPVLHIRIEPRHLQPVPVAVRASLHETLAAVSPVIEIAHDKDTAL